MKIKPWRFGILYLVLVMVVSLIVACAPPAEEIEGVAPSPIGVTDHAGRIVTIERMPEKIISLVPSITEVVYALGLEDKLVGVTKYCNYPEAAKDKPKVGGYSTVDIEKVLEMQPDLIIAANIHTKEVLPALERLGLTVISLNPKTIDEVLETMTLVGKCTGKEKEASRLVGEMRSRIKAVTDKTDGLTDAQRPGVFYAIRSDPFYTSGSDNRIHELLVSAGGTNIFQDQSGISITVSLEAVIQANPQVMIAGAKMGGAVAAFEFLKTDERLSELDASINNRVYEINVDTVSRYGPRLVDALEEMARMIQPEIFGPVK